MFGVSTRSFVVNPPPSLTKTGVYFPNYNGAGQQSLITNGMANHPSLPWIITINPCPISAIAVGDGNYTRASLYKTYPNCFKVIGYIPTHYADQVTQVANGCQPTAIECDRTLAGMKYRIDQYKKFYPILDGLMFDEADNSTDPVKQQFYRDMITYARDPNSTPGAIGVTLNFIKMNPGTGVASPYKDMSDNVAIYEGSCFSGGPACANLSTIISNTAGYTKDKFAMAFHHVASIDTAAMNAINGYKPYVKFIAYSQIEYLDNPTDYETFLNVLDYGTLTPP